MGGYCGWRNSVDSQSHSPLTTSAGGTEQQLSAGLQTSGTDTIGQLGAAGGGTDYRQSEETSGQGEGWLVARGMWS